MANFNRVILAGNLTRDPELRYTPSGTAVASFAIAVNRTYKAGDEKKEETSFFDITFFGRRAEVVGEYLSKGRPILVEGRLQQRRWETDDGQKRSKVEVIGESFEFLGGGRGGSEPEGPAGSGLDSPPEFDDSDIPF